MFQVAALLLSFGFIACAHTPPLESASADRTTAATTTATAVPESKPEETVECHTPNVADSGYRVHMTSTNDKTFHGTIAGVAVWGTEKPSYEGDFKWEVEPKGNNCQAHFKTSTGVAITAQSAMASSGKARGADIKRNLVKSTMVLKAGGANEPLVCTLPPTVLEGLQKCQASVAQK